VPGVSPEGEDAARLWLEYGGRDSRASWPRLSQRSGLRPRSAMSSQPAAASRPRERRLQWPHSDACRIRHSGARALAREPKSTARGLMVMDSRPAAEPVIGLAQGRAVAAPRNDQSTSISADSATPPWTALRPILPFRGPSGEVFLLQHGLPVRGKARLIVCDDLMKNSKIHG
jgi:hypothetical protein